MEGNDDDQFLEVHANLKAYVEANGDGVTEESALQAISKVLNDKELAITDLIEMLEKYLTSSNDQERNRASLLLADLLDHSALQLYLPTAAVHLLVVFFCHRLSDYPSVLPSLKALIALVNQYYSVKSDYRFDLADILQTLFKNVHCPSFAQNIRQLTYNLIDSILSQSLARPADQTLKDVVAEVLNGIACAM